VQEFAKNPHVKIVRRVRRFPDDCRAASTRRCESIDDIDVVPPMCCVATLSVMIAFGAAAGPGAILQLNTNQIDLAHRRIDFNPVGRGADQEVSTRPTDLRRAVALATESRARFSENSAEMCNRSPTRESVAGGLQEREPYKRMGARAQARGLYRNPLRAPRQMHYRSRILGLCCPGTQSRWHAV